MTAEEKGARAVAAEGAATPEGVPAPATASSSPAVPAASVPSGSAAAPGVKTRAFKAALPYTLPICAGFLVLGLGYGFLMGSKGFPFVYPLAMSAVIFAGAMEFVTVDLLLSVFNPVAAFVMALVVNARHVFYGISMLDRFRGVGAKKPYLIFGMCDETFAITSSVEAPEGVDRGWFMFFVTLLNHLYWVGGATLGGVLGNVVTVDTSGLEFVLTALFLTIFVDQWRTSEAHVPAVLGVVVSVVCLALFGADVFSLPTMALIVIAFYLMWRCELPLSFRRLRDRKR